MKHWKTWMKAAAIRAIRTIAQTALAAVGVSAAFTEVDWKTVAGTALLAGLLSVLTSFSGLPEVTEIVYGESEDTHENMS